MTTTNNCVLCFLTVAVAVTSGFNEATSTEEPTIRVARSPQNSITDAILGANIQFIGQAARSGQSVIESKLGAARAMIEAGSDVIAAKVQAARDMADVALNGGKTIAGATLGTISETADGLVIALGYPAEANSRIRRDADKGGKQRDDEDDDKSGYEDDYDYESGGKDSDEKSGKRDKNNKSKRSKKDGDDDKSERGKKDDDDGKDDKSKKKSNRDDRWKRHADKENLGARYKRTLSPDVGRSDPDDFQMAGLIGSPCMGCMTEMMSRTVALKGGAVGMMAGKGGGRSAGAGVGAGLVRGISGGSGGKAGVGAGLVGGLGGKAGATGLVGGLGGKAGATGLVGGLGGKAGATGLGGGLGGKAGAGAGLVGGLGGKAGATDLVKGLGGKAGAGATVVGGGIGGAIGGKVEVVGRRKREARRFGGGRSRFSPARGGAPKKGQSDTSGGSESSGSSSGRLRQKRAIIEHVLQHLRRDKRQDTTTDTGDGGKTNCFSFHSFEESEEEKKFWESFHNMMNEHDNDWNFDFESEMCGTGGGSTGAVSTNAVEGAREATTPLPPTIEA